MESYKNLAGNSGVVAYEIEQDSITIQFEDSTVYCYTVQSAGASNIAEMQRLAAVGQGLNSFINRVIKNSYAQKIR